MKYYLKKYIGGLPPNLNWVHNRCSFDADIQILYADEDIRNKILNTNFNLLPNEYDKPIMIRIQEIFKKMNEFDIKYKFNSLYEKKPYKEYHLDMNFATCEAPWRILAIENKNPSNWEKYKNTFNSYAISYVMNILKLSYHSIGFIQPIPDYDSSFTRKLFYFYYINKKLSSLSYSKIQKFSKITQEAYNKKISECQTELDKLDDSQKNQTNVISIINKIKPVIDDSKVSTIKDKIDYSIAISTKLDDFPIYLSMLNNDPTTNGQSAKQYNYEKIKSITDDIINIDVGIDKYKLTSINILFNKGAIGNHQNALIYNEDAKKWYLYDDMISEDIREYKSLNEFVKDSNTLNKKLGFEKFNYKLIKNTEPINIIELICNIINNLDVKI
jgi:hypothetical protein